jgi:hypothetical protein
MRKGLLAGACLATIAMSGCWPQPGFGPEGQNFNPGEATLSPANVASLTQAWSAPMEGVAGQPLVDGRAVYTSSVVTRGGQAIFVVTATARATGAPEWRRELPTGTAASQFERLLSAADGKVLVFRAAPDGTGGRTLRFEELGARTGATVRTSPHSGVVDRNTVVVAGDAVAYQALNFSTFRPEVVVRSRQTLDVLWSAPLSDSSLSSLAPMLVVGGRLVTCDVDASVPVLRAYAIGGCGGAACSPLATVPLPPPPSGSAQYQVMAAMADGTVLVRRGWNSDPSTHHEVLWGSPRTGPWRSPTGSR